VCPSADTPGENALKKSKKQLKKHLQQQKINQEEEKKHQ
jgi:hypothetical protein